jgi:hypothetical protein
MTDNLELLRFMRRRHAQLSPQQASTCHKAVLLAIGDHIGGLLSTRLRGVIEEDGMWQYVCGVTRHRWAHSSCRRCTLG